MRQSGDGRTAGQPAILGGTAKSFKGRIKSRRSCHENPVGIPAALRLRRSGVGGRRIAIDRSARFTMLHHYDKHKAQVFHGRGNISLFSFIAGVRLNLPPSVCPGYGFPSDARAASGQPPFGPNGNSIGTRRRYSS